MKKRIGFNSPGVKKHIDVGRLLFIVFVTVTLMACFTLNVFAASVTVWEKAEEIMKDVYNQILAISTIAAVVTAAIALLMLNFSKAEKTVTESRAWLRRIIITWAILNGLGFIMAYITPFFADGRWNGYGGGLMGILDGIVEWFAEQVMSFLDLINSSVLGALGCDMTTFTRYFPAAETMYKIFVALGIGLILLNWVWQLFKNFGTPLDVEAVAPVKLSLRAIFFIFLVYFADEIVNVVLKIGGTPYNWILNSSLPSLNFGNFNSVLLTILGVCCNGTVVLIATIILIILAWNYIKLLFEAAERYVLLGVLVFTAPVAFAMGSSRSTSDIFKSWCRMFGGQVILLVMNAWCLRLFTSMVGAFLANPLAV